MCGICGIVRPDRAPIDARRVVRMRDAMVARGPDGFGLSRGAGFVLGHRRLAVMDLSEAGRQPMSNEDGSVEIVFNGEIYNFVELRRILQAAGHRFRSRCDTEVLVHGYESWGLEGLLMRIRGPYAFAVMDARSGQVHLARDPMGKKPLFYRWSDGELVFASSARALALGLPACPEIDLAAVDDYLWNLYIPGPRTIFAGVQKLLPAHALTIDRAQNCHHLVFWQADFFQPELGVHTQEWLERVQCRLAAAVRRRLVADVPIGILLSGGIDSGLITALAAQAAGHVRTFSVACDDPSLDESRLADSVARRWGTDHQLLPVTSSVREELPDLVAAMGEPLADTSAANVFAIARLARESVTVALTGDGGDEGFGGYQHFYAFYLAGRIRPLLAGPLRVLAGALGGRLRHGPTMVRRAGSLLRRTAMPLEKLFREVGEMAAQDRLALFTPDFQEQLGDHLPTDHYLRALARWEGRSLRRPLSAREQALPIDRVMQMHLETELPDDFLAKVDLATMGASLEARCPFLDVDVMELAMKIPASVRFLNGRRKGLLRALARRFLPTELVEHRKVGFAAPVGQWIRRRDWADLIEDLILGPQVEERGWFRRQTLQRLVDEHRQGRNHGQVLWSLAVLEQWLRLAVGRPRDLQDFDHCDDEGTGPAARVTPLAATSD
jgi:asparagine synthase (glutamine-hydrolysing)